jgi:tRNA modification GTPase
MTRASLLDGEGRAVDDLLACRYPAPSSFTGEDTVELFLHGNPLLCALASERAFALGARPAEPGEFTRRAFLNGKIDLAQAEGVADLVAARTRGAADAALRQSRGALGRRVAPLGQALREILVELAGEIDFPDEDDVPSLDRARLDGSLASVEEGLDGLAASFRRGRLLREGAVVAIAGAPNVGKSSLLNRLAGEERAIVTDRPGTTRDALHAEAEAAGIRLRLVDTAGLRETEDPVEREGVRRSREAVGEAELVLFVLDASRRADEGDRLAYGEVEGTPHLVLLNKADLPGAEDGAAFRGRGHLATLSLSARTGEGIGILLAEAGRRLAGEGGDALGEGILTRERHLAAVIRAGESIRRARAASAEGLAAEFVAADVGDAAEALASLAGRVAPEEILDAVFSSFCVGK